MLVAAVDENDGNLDGNCGVREDGIRSCQRVGK
jgi:hypothetical protein